MKATNYPIITAENFERMTDTLVAYRKGYRGRALKVRKPRTRQEFYDMTKAMYGVGLGVTGRVGFYQIEAAESIYARLPIGALWDKKYSQYDGLKVLLEVAFGKLSTGAVAHSHYGSHDIKGYRDKLRLQKFWQSEFVPSDEAAVSKS